MANSPVWLAFCGAFLGLLMLAPRQSYAAALSRRALAATKGDIGPSLARQGLNDMMPSESLRGQFASLMQIPKGSKIQQKKFAAALPTQVVQDQDGGVTIMGGRVEAGRLKATKHSKTADGGSSSYSSDQSFLSHSSFTHMSHPRFAQANSLSSMKNLLENYGVGRAELTGHGAPVAALPHSESGSRAPRRSEPIIEEVFDDEPEPTVAPKPQEYLRAPKIEEYHEPEPQTRNVPSAQTVQQGREKTTTSDNTAQQTSRTLSTPSRGRNQAATYPKITEVEDEHDAAPLRGTQTTSSSSLNPKAAETDKPLTKQSGLWDSHPVTPPSPRQSREVTLEEFFIVIRRRFGAQRQTEILPFLEYVSKSRTGAVENKTKFESAELAEAYVDWLNSNVVNNSFESMLKQGKELTKDKIAGAIQKMTFEERAELMHPDLTAAQMQSLKNYMSSKDGLNNGVLNGEPWSDDAKELYEKWKQTPKPWTYHLAHIWQKMIRKMERFNEKVWLSVRGIWAQKPKIPTEIHSKAA